MAHGVISEVVAMSRTSIPQPSASAWRVAGIAAPGSPMKMPRRRGEAAVS